MAKKNSKKSNKKMSPGGKKVKVQVAPMKRVGDGGYRQAVLRMWSDPCTAQPVRPPYAGMDTGYLVRTVDEIALSVPLGAVVGNEIPVDVILQWTPSNYGTGTGYVFGINGVGLNVSLSAGSGPGNFIIGTTVRDFRPVASCLQWVPNGPIGTRSGVVNSVYSPNTEVQGGSSLSASSVNSLCQHSATNAGGSYEVNWLPTLSDERFTTASEGNLTGRGTVLMVLRGVDATTTAVASSTLNGYFRVTTIWEWTPAVSQGLTLDPAPPVPHTTQSILGTVKNVRDIIYGAVKLGQMAGIGFGANPGDRMSSRSIGF